MRLIHIIRDDDDAWEAIVLCDNPSEEPADHCPPNTRIYSITEIDGDSLPGSLPTEYLMIRSRL